MRGKIVITFAVALVCIMAIFFLHNQSSQEGSAGITDRIEQSGKNRVLPLTEARPKMPSEKPASNPEQHVTGSSVTVVAISRTDIEEEKLLSAQSIPDGIPESFFTLSEREQVKIVNRYLKASTVRRPVLQFFRDSLIDKRLSALVRNNMALTIGNGQIEDDQICRHFIQSIEDPEEIPKWRMYAIQFLARSYPLSNDPEGVAAKLQEVFSSYEEPYSSQAMVMLAELEREGLREFRELNAEIAQRAVRENGTSASRATALALLGARKAWEYVDVVRKVAGLRVPEQRVAVASLGQIGDKSDLPLLKSISESDKAGILGIAARQSIKEIEGRP